MKKLLNTVYVTTEGAALKKDGENLVAEVEGAEKARVPLHMLASVVAFGPILLSPALIGICAERGIPLPSWTVSAVFRRASRDQFQATSCCAARNTGLPIAPRTSCAPSSWARSPTSAP